MHYLSSVYFVIQPLHVSGVFVAPSSGGILYVYSNWYVLYIYSTPPEYGLQISSKHVEVE
jgi:hypothetical protein